MSFERSQLGLAETDDEVKESKDEKDAKPFSLESISISELKELISQVESCIETLSDYYRDNLFAEVISTDSFMSLLGTTFFGALSYFTWGCFDGLDLRARYADKAYGLASICLVFENVERIFRTSNANVSTLDDQDTFILQDTANKLTVNLTNQTLKSVAAMLKIKQKELGNLLERKLAKKKVADIEAGNLAFCARQPNSTLHPFFSNNKFTDYLRVRDYLDEPSLIKRKHQGG